MGEKVTCPECGYEIDSRTILQKINEETFALVSKEASEKFPKGHGHKGTSLKRAYYIKERYEQARTALELAHELGVKEHISQGDGKDRKRVGR